MTKQEFLDRARAKHGYKYNYIDLGDKILSSDDIKIEYNDIIYTQRVVKHILLGRCPEKNTPTRTQDEYLSECKKIWGDKYDYSLVEYKNAYKKIKIIYDGIIFEQNPQSHINGMAPELKSNKDYFIKKSKDKWGEEYDYSLVDYKGSKVRVSIIHKKTGIVYNQSPTNHLIHKPENINLSIRKTTEQFIKESNIIHDNKYNYDKTKYIKNQIKVIITCPTHGDFSQNPLSHTQGNGCPNCNESKGEKEIAKFLNKWNINYSRQHKFSDCKNIFELPFDFYIPSMRICIEFDGRQHYEPMEFFGGLKAYEILKVNDKIKNDYCEDNYINLIRIRYDEFDSLHQILWENLKTFIKK